MTTTFLVNLAELSRQIGDYWSSTTTGAGTATTLVDTALAAQADDWIAPSGHWAFLIEEPGSAASIYDERMATSLDASSKTLTTLSFSAAPGTGIDYEIHRLFAPSEKKRALLYAARASFPHLHEKIWDESFVSGNWLIDGSFETWTSSSALTHWTTTTSTIAQTTSSPYYKHGATSCQIIMAAGTVKQSITNWDDLKRLAGQSVTFTIQAHSDTASNLRISINDGATQTYSSYHAGDSAWTQDDPRIDNMYVQHFIDYNPTEITFTVHHEVDAATSYVDDARVIGPPQPRLYIAGLGLAQDRPAQVLIEPYNYSTNEPWALIHNTKLDTESGYLYLPSSVMRDRRLRIIGMGYLDFLASGVSSTAWTATININSPQTDILIAQAILYLYTWMSMPNFQQGDRQDFMEMMGFWENELRKRKGKFSMPIPSIPVNWR